MRYQSTLWWWAQIISIHLASVALSGWVVMRHACDEGIEIRALSIPLPTRQSDHET